MEKQILPLGMIFDLVENEGQILGQVAQTDVTEGVRGSGLDLFAVVIEAVQTCLLESGILAQVAEREEIRLVLNVFRGKVNIIIGPCYV